MSARWQVAAARERERAALAVLPGLLAERSALAASNAELVRPHPYPRTPYPGLLLRLRAVRW